MLIVTGEIKVGEGGLETLLAAAQTMVAETRKEPGCRSYGFYQDIGTPTTIRIYEEWEDEAALAAHFKAPHMAAFNAAVGGADVKSISVVKFEPGEMTKLI